MFKANEQQLAVFKWALEDEGHLNLIARAGCGKTTTLVELCKRLPGDRIWFGAFNKAISTEIAAKLAAVGCGNVDATTFHAKGFAAVRKAVQGVKLEEDWIYEWLKDNMRDINGDGERPFIKAVVSIARQHALGCPGRPKLDESLLYEMVDAYGLADDLPEASSEHVARLIAAAIQLMKIRYETLETLNYEIDFDDMLYVPLKFNLPMPKYDWVLVDEAQDTNPARREIAIKMLARDGRLVCVGDPAQAIYGFAGADYTALDLIREKMGSSELPLNQTFRCPKAIVKLANEWVPDLVALPAAPEGEVLRVNGMQWDYTEPGPGDAVLCRVNRVLLGLAFKYIRAKKPFRIEGRDMGNELVKFARKFKVDSLARLSVRIEDWKIEEVERAKQDGKTAKVARILDKADTMQVVIYGLMSEGHTLVDALVAFVNAVFMDNAPGTVPVLSSIHKAKGREWERVFLLGRNVLMPHPMVVKSGNEGALLQENNLQYVAVTRVKRTLVEVSFPDPQFMF